MPGLLRGVPRTAVIAGTATTVSNRVSRRQGNRWARRTKPARAQPRSAEPGSAPQSRHPSRLPRPTRSTNSNDSASFTDRVF